MFLARKHIRPALAAFAVVLMIGTGAVVGVPIYLRSAETAKVNAAYDFLCDVQSAQQRHYDQYGEFSQTLDDLDLARLLPPYFSSGSIRKSAYDQWSLTLTRVGSTFGVGAYDVVFNQDGMDQANSELAANMIQPRLRGDVEEARYCLADCCDDHHRGQE
ncbi:hypothetical protein K227x_45650 [Rubripirellula lacrimiformis]|uniref:Uncharacterized protein n=1 Tax=Rubripirellula lacrimiformis TaxID=1930273 RepID=A0A517NG94_9BACT|nr:hypothetical protein [Rubripirellula lacrimiformis]QDT06157.1 hypothetical protein K227x_45650 [Rubripirellula lacrimiformis]